ncbi:ParA family protein [Lacticaseibacillus paracasei]|uniref:Chromosome partitioning ATPase n=1 Tax=Lacticaseibacillus paracasei (strain ATCC 334 / BCRC 17002 / CCUG 31169 / CIP 107868 / KCTC 3260 / NRRL B-441) TaxID=321967 RepID=Q036Y9_LACP3|nr:ParA family protein [Lacticaseibacillus paracasei]ABD83425.1 putative chromosome partitioning ATPase [Lacticaseibacillus paracasei ATCC 334]ABJ70733.1 Chromosome partitioning ATPase [Lacticaseibacillus paracasei ATCC 334]OSY81106.1 chromosome partitioning protein ParA [Lacticaseibacillus paracasei]
MTAKVISFINMKGGVGKTTLCVGVSEFMAHFKSKKILLIDLDPQFNATQTLMDMYDLTDQYMNDIRFNKTIRLLFEETHSVSERPVLPKPDKVILHLDTSDVIDGELDIICGSIDLIKDDDSRKSKYKRVRKFLREQGLLKHYDYIFIDCPPTISFYTDAALYASDYYIVPTRIDRYSILGINLLKTVIEQAKFDDDLSIEPLGLIYTNYPTNNIPAPKQQEILDVLEENKDVLEIGVFRNKFHYLEHLMTGKSGNIASKYVKSKKDIEKISVEIESKVH